MFKIKRMKITFDKVEIEKVGFLQSEAERRFDVPTNNHLEIGKVTQVGSEVEDIKVGDFVYYLNGSRNLVTGTKYFIREREILFKGDEENMVTRHEDVRVKDMTSGNRETTGGILIPHNATEGSLQSAEVLNFNPDNNPLGLKKKDVVYYKKSNGERKLIFDGSVLLRQNQIIYTT